MFWLSSMRLLIEHVENLQVSFSKGLPWDGAGAARCSPTDFDSEDIYRCRGILYGFVCPSNHLWG